MSTVLFRYSKDGGHNFTDYRERSLGEVGDFMRDVEWTRMGRGRQWVFDIVVVDPVPAHLLAASIKIEGSQ